MSIACCPGPPAPAAAFLHDLLQFDEVWLFKIIPEFQLLDVRRHDLIFQKCRSFLSVICSVKNSHEIWSDC